MNTKAIDLTEALLLLSRAEQRSFARTKVDLSLVAEEAAETLLPFAEARGIAVHVSGDVVTTDGSTPLLSQLATNLLHNAIVHNVLAADPGPSWVSLRTARRPGGATLVVENTDQWCRPRSSTHSGLVIVEAIVRAHAGILTITPRDPGGLTVVVQLPATNE